jgi:hypothetical protein
MLTLCHQQSNIKYYIGSLPNDFNYDSLSIFLNEVFEVDFFSAEYIRWKHYLNPHGCSLVVFAYSGDSIVGFRAMQKTSFISSSGGTSIECVQACDTAVHPHFRNVGIFSKMTKMANNFCLRLNYDFIYNFPNKLSLPGYIKLGWRAKNKIYRYGCLYLSFFQSILDTLFGSDLTPAFKLNESHLSVINTFAKENNHNNYNIDLSVNYLAWRFISNPKDKYGIFYDNDLAIIYKLNKRYFLYFIEQVLVVGCCHLPTDNSSYRRALKKIAHNEKIGLIISYSETKNYSTSPFEFMLPSNVILVSKDLNSSIDSIKLNFQPVLFDTM